LKLLSSSDSSSSKRHISSGTAPGQYDPYLSIKSLSDGPYDLDVDKIIKDIGDEKVPVVAINYEDHNPIQGHIAVRKFIEENWMKNNPKLYLHQWQFPLSSSQKVHFFFVFSSY
jgi:hypothetical protein